VSERCLIAFDPGAKTVGVCEISLPGREYVRSADVAVPVLHTTGQPLVTAVDMLITEWMCEGVPRVGCPDVDRVLMFAVEETVRPRGWDSETGRSGLVNPGPVVRTAYVEGLISAWCHYWNPVYAIPVVRVHPTGFGRGYYLEYPPGLVSASEQRADNWRHRRAGRGKLRHQRSAYDIAQAAAVLYNPMLPAEYRKKRHQ